MLLSKVTSNNNNLNNNNLSEEIEKQYIDICTVRMFIEQVPSTNNHYINPFPIYNKDS